MLTFERAVRNRALALSRYCEPNESHITVKEE